MKERAGKIVDKARGALPEGTFAVGAGLIVAAITAYVFVIIALNNLNGQEKAGFSAFWALIFVAGPGFFLPIEQEVSRAIAHRRAQGIGSKPLAQRAARLGIGLTVILVIATIACGPLLVDNLFHGETMLVYDLAVGLIGFFAMHLCRGLLSGNGRFRPYGEMMGSEAVFRLLGAIGLTIAGVHSAGAYGACLAIAPFLAVAFSMRGQRGLLTDGPPAPYSELSSALGYLLAGSVLMQLLGYAPLLGVNLLETNGDKAAAAAFASAFFVARIPILLFQAVQGTLLPKLAGLAGAGKHGEFRAGLMRLLMIVVGIAAVGALAAFTIGPAVGKILFKDFTISNVNLGLLALGSGAFIIALTLAQALIALNGHARVAFAWLVGVIGFVVVCAALSDLFLRVELGFLFGSALSALVMGLMLWLRLRGGEPEDVAALVEAIEHEPLEL